MSQHSYRVGLWEAKEFARQQGAEGWRRGAGPVVSINEGESSELFLKI